MKKQSIVYSILLFLILLFYASYTDHRWEDWYITYKVSKNLALGNGLVFMPGERVHTFTSAINVLVPAFFAAFIPSNPDEAAIWGYRGVNTLAIILCGILIFQLGKKLELLPLANYFLLFLFAFNSLIIDNSINGMEAPYMMLFFLCLLYGLYVEEKNKIPWYVAAFTGLMYTRPDGFVYASFIFWGYYIFHFKELNASTIKTLSIALSISILLYLPWLLFTWNYYGSPIPNTITAKGNLKTYSVLDLFIGIFMQAKNLFFKENVCAAYLFLPGYAGFGEWFGLEFPSRFIIGFCFICFLIPKMPSAVKAFSLSGYLMIYYLEFVSGQGGMPWYLPNPTLMLLITMGLLASFWIKNSKHQWIPSASIFAFSIIYISIFFFGAYYFKTQQRIVEWGNRKKVGDYLKANSPQNASVFAECLGYIGFFSQQKMYDYPGMSSKEVVDLLRKVKKSKRPDFGDVIENLHPYWLVLRPDEIKAIKIAHPKLLENNYKNDTVFDVSNQIPEEWYLLGKKYLEFDSKFIVFRKN